MKYEVRFIRTQVLDNPIVEAKDEKEAIKLAEKLIHKYDFKDYETTEVVEVDEE
jgi:penicillin V acylase-like amidase (Ntn superfamily)